MFALCILCKLEAQNCMSEGQKAIEVAKTSGAPGLGTGAERVRGGMRG